MSIQRDRIKAWEFCQKESSLFLPDCLCEVGIPQLGSFLEELHCEFYNLQKKDVVNELYLEENIYPYLNMIYYCLSEFTLRLDLIESFHQSGFNGSDKLPQGEGIYLFCWKKNPKGEDKSYDYMTPLYIGKTNNLSQRFCNHHRLSEMQFLHNMGEDIFFSYLTSSEYFKIADLGKLEKLLIETLMPVLNGTEYLSSNKNGIVKLPNSQPLLSSLHSLS